MKSLIFLGLVALAIASDFEMKLEENGEKFSEKIKVDVAGNTEEIQVPKHQDRVAVDILNDFNIGLQAVKMLEAKQCHISKIDGSEQKPNKMEMSLKLARSKFPEDRFMVENVKSLRIRYLSAEEVGAKIAAHCSGYEMILVVKVTKENIEQKALNIVKAMKARSKRDVQIRTFITCKYDSVNVVGECRPEKLGARCSFYRTDQRVCAYKVTCTQSFGSDGRPVANCAGSHQYNLYQCCDFFCNP